MTTREKIALGACVLLHAYVLWNVYQADKLTPRLIVIDMHVCPQSLDRPAPLPQSST